MSTTIPITTDTLLGNVPKLDIKGMNWVIFLLHFRTAVKAKELWPHFDGTSIHPVGTTTTATDGTSIHPVGTTTTATDGTVITSLPDADELVKWQKSENMAKHLLTQCIPNSTALRVWSLHDIEAMWNEIVHEYTEKGAYAQTDLRTKFLGLQCPVNGDVHQFLDDLHTKRDELAAISVQIKEKDYRSTIIQSLPKYLASFASGQLATACLYSPTQTIDPNILISLIIEESECRNRKETRNLCSKQKARDGDEALAVAPGSFSSQGQEN